METTLLLAGGALFLVCTLLFLRYAFANTVGWGVAGLLFPPSAILFYAVAWKKLKALALVHLASLVLFVLVAMMWVRANPFALDDTGLAWLRNLWAPAFAESPMNVEKEKFVSERELQPYLQGRIHPAGQMLGEPVNFVRTTLLNNVLRFKSDENVFARMEVAIPLEGISLKPGENLLEYTPESTDNPPVHITYYPEGQQTPEVKVYSHRFWLELMLSVKDGPLYSGYVKLRLPDRQRSFVAGEFRAYTRDLRFEDDVVDRFFDSNATIEYVAEQWMVNKLGNVLERVTGFRDTFFQTVLEHPTGRTDVIVRLVDGTEHTLKIGLLKGSEGWVVESGPSPELIQALRTLRSKPAGAISRQPVRERVKVVDPSSLDHLIGKTVVISTFDGKQRSGTISEVDQHNVTLMSPVDGGSMGILVKRREITEVKLSH
jgi:hypothetical protein